MDRDVNVVPGVVLVCQNVLKVWANDDVVGVVVVVVIVSAKK